MWIYQGLVPKLLLRSPSELQIWQFVGFDLASAQIGVMVSGVLEILFGCVFLMWRKAILPHQLNILGLGTLLLLVMVVDPLQLTNAFNPVIMNVAMMVLSIVAIQLLQRIKNRHSA
nr:DoxX-like family protein [Acinetobacter sp. GSS19]